MLEDPIDASPWQQFADHYFAGTPSRQRVADRWEEFERRYAPLRQSGDPGADSVAQALIDRRISRADFERALTLGIDAVDELDPVLGDFFAQIDQVPDGIDMDAVRRGGFLLKQIPITVFVTHGVVAGFVFAAINPNSAIPLSLNQSIARATRRRYIETTQYVADTAAAGGLERFGPGLQAACRVRLVHALIRIEIARHYDWNSTAYGAPINPIALLAAAAVPDVWAARFAERHGCRFTPDQLRDITMHNAYLCYLQGVPPEFLITDYQGYCDYLCWAICQSDLPLPEDHERALSVLKPLLENGYPLSGNGLANWFFNQTIFTATRQIMGDRICDAYGIPRSRQAVSLAAALTILNRVLITARSTPGLRRLYRRGTERYWDVTIPRLVNRITGERTVTYATTANTRPDPAGDPSA